MERYCVAHPSRRFRSFAVLGFLAVSLALTATAAHAADARSETVYYRIQSGYAPATLNEFSQQSNLQVLFDLKALRHVQTRAVYGSHEPLDALMRMLEGTDLQVKWVDDHTLSIMHRKK